MSDKQVVKRNQSPARPSAAKTIHAAADTHPNHKAKDSKIDAEVKNAAGEVQEELTPIRHTAGRAHTH